MVRSGFIPFYQNYLKLPYPFWLQNLYLKLKYRLTINHRRHSNSSSSHSARPRNFDNSDVSFIKCYYMAGLKQRVIVLSSAV